MAIPLRRDTSPRDRTTPVGGVPVHPARRDAIVADAALALLRVVAGLMLVQHGVQKHFGVLMTPGKPLPSHPALFTQSWIAGTLELVGGILVALGLFTRPVAFLLSGELAVAYFQVHAPRGFFPIQNAGELAALYSFVFLLFAAMGGGRYSVDALIGRRPRARLTSDD